ncbi:MAG: GMC family oxidoreductase N-terminal domain-containing protein [Gemmatimonadaceae bacterium]
MSPAGDLLTGTERRTLAAVCDALLPRLDPRDGDSAALFALSAADVDLAGSVERAMSILSARQIRGLRLFIRLLDSRFFMLLAARHRSGFSAIQRQEDREAALLALASSPIPQVRSGYQALKRLATFLFYAATDERGGNATWQHIGYEVPRPRPAQSLLRVTRIRQPTTFDVDVCVIGSGAGGGVVAAQLAAAGRSVVVLEAGPPDQAADFDQREIVGMQRLYLDQGATATRDVSVAMLAGSCVGGGTSVNWQTSLRLPDYVRDEWTARSGIRLFSEEAFGRAFDSVERRLSVGTSESVPNANNAPLQRACEALGYHWSAIPRNSHHCDLAQCGFCVFGCRHGGKQSTANTYLVDAQSSGQTTIVAGCKADRVILGRGRVAGVEAAVLDEDSGQRFRLRVNAQTVVVAAGGLETPALLLRSGLDHPQLGRNLHLHPTTALAGYYADPVRGWIGAPQSVLCDEFSRVHGDFGYRIETAPLHPGLSALAHAWYGARAHRRSMQDASRASGFIVLTRDVGNGRVRIDREGRTMIDYHVDGMGRDLLRQGMATAARLHWAAGAQRILTFHTREHSLQRGAGADIDAYCRDMLRLPVDANRCGIFSAHQMGTCGMGSDPRSAVCDERGQALGIAGLYVADASLFPASSGVNPMLTVMALAHIVGSGIANE